MIFSKKKITIAYSIEKCVKCGSLRKRKFVEGDMLFGKSKPCDSCNEITTIEKIFGETLET